MHALSHRRRRSGLVIGLVLAAVSLSACSSSPSASSSTGAEKVTITFLTTNGDSDVKTADALVAAFEKEYPDISVTVDTRPGGTEGDNFVKTQLSTGEMDDVFYYNSGSLMQALNPDTTLVDLSGSDWLSSVDKNFVSVVSTEKGTYGAPFGTSLAGGMIYNKKVFASLGLEIPKDWATFMSAAQTIKNAGITPVEQTYGDTWTAQMFVLSDFANVLKVDPNWATDYTANKAKFVDEPAFAGFEHLAAAYTAGLFNADFASATNADGVGALATGKAAMYPMLSSAALSGLMQNYPDNVDDIGIFAMPADSAADTALTVWEPNALYIPQTTTGAKLDAAKKFVAFANSSAGCEVQNTSFVAAGPYVTSACKVSADAAPMVADIADAIAAGTTAPALEFLSPVKGPNLENISIEVGSGISSAADGAAAYDADVQKQAQQLGLAGW